MNFKDIKILSGRQWNNYFPLQVVYEWEDIIARELNISIDNSSTLNIKNNADKYVNRQLQKLIRRTFLSESIDSSFNYLKNTYPDDYFLAFFLYPLPMNNHYIYSENVLPILLDCFKDVIDKVPVYFKRSRLLFVTNYEVYNYLGNTTLKDKLVYLPLSISDDYCKEEVPAKDIDVLQMGRQNDILHDWMLKISEANPDVEYVYSKLKDGVHTYYSTQKGWMGPVENRKDFMSFLSRAKISLLSSPGIDGGEARTGGFNPVTPRFFESAVNYCYMAGRYPTDGEDFKYCNVKDVCDHYDRFDIFENFILTSLKQPFNQKQRYNPFIKQHLTSQRATIISKALQNL